MEIHQCMTCGERWGVGTSAAGISVEKHRKQGHEIFVGVDEVLAAAAKAVGIDVGSSITEPMPVYRCLDCDELWVLGTEDAMELAKDHKARGHRVFQGDETDMRKLSRMYGLEERPQTPNPLDPKSVAGGGTIMSLGGPI